MKQQICKIKGGTMVEYKMLNELKNAFKTLMTLDTITDDKEEMEFLIEACARYVSTHHSMEEIKEKIGTVEGLMALFKEYLDHLQYQM
jgi:hypothetical protein